MQNSETTKQAAKQRQARKKGRRKKTTSIFFLLSFFILCVLSTAHKPLLVCVCICVGRLTAAAAADSSFLRSTVRAGSCKQQAVSCQWQRGAEGKRKNGAASSRPGTRVVVVVTCFSSVRVRVLAGVRNRRVWSRNVVPS